MQLFINTKSTLLKRRGNRFVVRVPSIDGEYKTHEFSASKIHSILIATGVRITSDSIVLAHENKIDIVFLSTSGHPISRVWQCRMGSTSAIRRQQLTCGLGHFEKIFENGKQRVGLEFVVRWLNRKTENQIGFLTELAKRRSSNARSLQNAAATLRDITHKVQDISSQKFLTKKDIANLLGLEGSAGRVYFENLSKLLPSQYRFSKRSRRPALDPFNAALNYGYGVLYSLVEKSIILAGLDPFIGFFHTDNYNKPSLVYDLIEPFRIAAEKTVTLLCTGKRFKESDFSKNGGVELSPDGRAKLIEALNKRLDKPINYYSPFNRGESNKKFRRIKFRDAIQHEAHRLANALLGKDSADTWKQLEI